MATKKPATWRSRKTGENLLNIFTEESEIIVFDTETTGFKATDGDRIIQISALKLRIPDMFEIDRIDEYINPGFSVSAKITELTGITNEFLSDKPMESEVFPKIFAFFGETPVIAAHNTGFDKRFMEQLYIRNNELFLPKKECDTLEMARDLVPKEEKENNKLGTIAHIFGVDEGLTFHNSMDDVIAASRLLKIFKGEYETRFQDFESPDTLISPKVTSIRFWEGFRGFSRLYVNTDRGTFYYDIRGKVWGGKSDNCYKMEEIDMESLVKSAFDFVGVTTEQEFAKYRG